MPTLAKNPAGLIRTGRLAAWVPPDQNEEMCAWLFTATACATP